MQQGEYTVYQSEFDVAFNQDLVAQYLAAKDLPEVKKTHYFNGRFENIYLDEDQVPALSELRADARARAARILGRPVRKMGCWFNAMGAGNETTLHSHDDDDEVLSGVYYARVPENSGNLIIHQGGQPVEHTPQAGQWVFFSSRTPHAVSLNHSEELRLSIAFNFC